MLKLNALHSLGPVTALLLLGFSGLSYAETPATPAAAPAPVQEHKDVPVVSDAAEQKIIDYMHESNQIRLKGWPGMVFYCPAESSSVPALKQICLDSYKNLETLAAANNVKFHKARNANDSAILPHLTGRAKLLIELTATDPGVDPAAISAHVAVYAHYAHAVNRANEVPQQDSNPNAPKHPTLVPQHVDAVLWEATVVKAAAGSTEQLVQPVTQAVNEKLTAFFAEYAKANH